MEKELAKLSENINLRAIDDAVHNILGSNHVTLTIRDRQTGEIVYNYRGKHLMRPASNMKLISGAAALAILGEQYTFSTQLYIDGVVEGYMLNGNIYIKGNGDPTLNGRVFECLAQQLKGRGITEITGNIIGDDTLFPGETLPPGVDDEGETHYYGARISPITMSPNEDYDASTIYITANPTSIGEAPTYEVVPYISGHTIKNIAQTVASGEENTLEIRRTNGTNEIIISGNLPVDESAKVWVSLQNPTINTLQFMKFIFEQNNIVFSFNSKVEQGIVPYNAEHIYTHISPTVAEIFDPFMKLSNNSIADILVKTIGHERYGVGNYESGLKEVRAYLRQKNIDIQNWQFVDGSGLSHGIRIDSEGISKLLFEVQREPYFDVFFKSLPVAGHPDRAAGGTLRERYTEPQFENLIFAKTGYIHEVNALSGYVTGRSGHQYIFSLLQEGYEEGIEILDKGLKQIVENI